MQPLTIRVGNPKKKKVVIQNCINSIQKYFCLVLLSEAGMDASSNVLKKKNLNQNKIHETYESQPY